MKQQFKVTIEETVSQTFEVEAESVEDALQISKDKYYSCEFVLAPGELVGKQISASLSDSDEQGEWHGL